MTKSTVKLNNIRNDSAQPLYMQIKENLKQGILDGTYVVHERLPSENKMMKIFGVSRITVRQALRDLHNDGLVFSVQGKGTFVSKPTAIQNIQHLQGFSEAMSPRGYETSSKIISLKEEQVTKDVAHTLELTKDERVIALKRVRYLNREPISIDHSYFPLTIGKQLMNYDMTKDVFSILENELGILLGHADVKIGATTCSNELSSHLNTNPGSAILMINRLVRTRNGNPIDYEYLMYRGDAFQYELRLDRK